MEALVRGTAEPFVIVSLVVALGAAPLAAQSSAAGQAPQSTSSWSLHPRLEVTGGLFKPMRDIGKILGSEVLAQIKTTLQTAPMYQVGLFVSTPYPGLSLRASVSYLTTDASGQSGACQVASGPGCATYEVSTTLVTSTLDFILHSGDDLRTDLRYFVAGIGVRHWAFDEGGCQGLDSIRYKVCNPMEEFLSDQFRPVVRLGVGYRKRLGSLSWVVEVVDFAGPFHGAGLQGSGGVQNDIVFSTGISLPRG